MEITTALLPSELNRKALILDAMIERGFIEPGLFVDSCDADELEELANFLELK